MNEVQRGRYQTRGGYLVDIWELIHVNNLPLWRGSRPMKTEKYWLPDGKVWSNPLLERVEDPAYDLILETWSTF